MLRVIQGFTIGVGSARKMDGAGIPGRPCVHQQIGRLELRRAPVGVGHVRSLAVSRSGRT